MASNQLRRRVPSQSDGNGAGRAEHCDDVDDRRKRPRRPPSFFPLHPFRSLVRFLSRLLATWSTYVRWRSTRLRDFGAALPADDEGDFTKRNPSPTDEALASLGLANCRDVASACSSGIVVPGRLFRSSSPFALSSRKEGGEGDEDDDVSAAAEETARLLSHAAASSSSAKGLNLALVIDLRSDNEWEQGGGDAVVEALLSTTRGKRTGDVDDADAKTDSTTTTTTIKVERVPLQEWRRYLFAFVARLPIGRALGAASHFLLYKHVLRFEPPLPGMHERLCLDTERGGILAMNTTVLAAFPLEIARVLRLISSALSHDSPPSVMVACKLGKDRTGIVSALCLAVAGASLDDVVGDYAQSAVELSGRPPPATAPSLGGAPRAAMEGTLAWLAEHWGRRAPRAEVERYRRGEKRGGPSPSSSHPPARLCWRSGVIGYLEHEARFLSHEREALRRALTE